MSDERVFRFLFDVKTKQVACPLIQAVAGGDREACFFWIDWQTSLTTDLVWISATAAQIKEALEKK